MKPAAGLLIAVLVLGASTIDAVPQTGVTTVIDHAPDFDFLVANGTCITGG
ncbi:MAG TPA: hypothetical protein VHY79_11905 [Rhizomicrobium sp.]|jgi:hypothetical protein|nr:hypothetical protein [Rhizomicrobium sp.]